MKYSRQKNRLAVRALLACVLLGVVAGTCFADQPSRPSYLGFAAAYPERGLTTTQQEDRLRNRQDSLAWLLLEIDAAGKLVTIVADTVADTTLTGHLAQFMTDMSFEPAMRDGDRVASRLPIAVRIRPGGLMPFVTWPVDTSGRVQDQDLYQKALGLNGVTPPGVVRFPAYHASVKRKDSAAIYPYLIASMTLDSSGAPTAIDLLRSTTPGFSDQLLNACNWAEYTPALVNGVPRACSLYLVISLFPELHYPVTPLDFSQWDSLPRLHQSRVRVVLDSTGPLAKALPRFISDDSTLYDGGDRIPPSAGTGLCLVDPTGRARAGRVASISSFQPRVRKFVGSLQFYPALSWSGEPQSFNGPFAFVFPGSAYARIQLLWLPGDNSWLAQ